MKFKSRCILVAACIGLCSAAFADTIEITSTASPTIALNPSSDTLSFLLVMSPSPDQATSPSKPETSILATLTSRTK